MSKIPKVVAQYLPARWVDNSPVLGIGTFCQKCRDFIPRTSECVIVIDSKVHPTRGTCCLYVAGPPNELARPLRLIPKSVAGYIEGPEVPTYCGRCDAYEQTATRTSTCSRVGDFEEDLVERGGCCNSYEARKDD